MVFWNGSPHTHIMTMHIKLELFRRLTLTHSTAWLCISRKGKRSGPTNHPPFLRKTKNKLRRKYGPVAVFFLKPWFISLNIQLIEYTLKFLKAPLPWKSYLLLILHTKSIFLLTSDYKIIYTCTWMKNICRMILYSYNKTMFDDLKISTDLYTHDCKYNWRIKEGFPKKKVLIVHLFPSPLLNQYIVYFTLA